MHFMLQNIDNTELQIFFKEWKVPIFVNVFFFFLWPLDWYVIQAVLWDLFVNIQRICCTALGIPYINRQNLRISVTGKKI